LNNPALTKAQIAQLHNREQRQEVKMKPTFIVLLALCLCLPVMGAEKEKPLPKDFKSLKVLAYKGDAQAQSALGAVYAVGQGVKQDFKEAMKWWRKAAEQEDVKWQAGLGMMYYKGKGVKQDDKEAGKWFHKSAEQGLSVGQVCLAQIWFSIRTATSSRPIT
jgi:hypothetical protein